MADLKLGKKDATYKASDLRFADYRLATPINVPTIFGHGNTFTNWGMLGNDQWGDCVFAGAAHETMDLDNLGRGGHIHQNVTPFSDQSVLSDYSAVTGFNPNDPGTDKGTEVRAALDYRVNTGVIDAAGKRHKIAAYVALEPGNWDHLLQALYIFDVVGIGIQFPGSAMDQFNNNQPWSVAAGATIEGGHYVPLVGIPSVGSLTCITWGRTQNMTQQFFQTYCDEAYAILSPEAINPRWGNRTYEGFNWAQLNADLPLVK